MDNKISISDNTEPQESVPVNFHKQNWADFTHDYFNDEEKKRQAFLAVLRDPDMTQDIHVGDDVITYGYWRVEDGIICLRKFANGYHPWNERSDYPMEKLDILVQLIAKKPTPMNTDQPPS